jgi:hypothetical protein
VVPARVTTSAHERRCEEIVVQQRAFSIAITVLEEVL